MGRGDRDCCNWYFGGLVRIVPSGKENKGKISVVDCDGHLPVGYSPER